MLLFIPVHIRTRDDSFYGVWVSEVYVGNKLVATSLPFASYQKAVAAGADVLRALATQGNR